MDTVIGPLLDCTIKPILHQLDYLFHYHGNIKEVKEKLETLGTTKVCVEILISQDKGKGNAIFDDVTKWMDNVEKVLVGQNEAPNPSCFNCIQRHQLSRKAKKSLEDIVELINKGSQFNKDNVGYPVPSPHTSSSNLPPDYQFFESRTLLAEKIKDALANPNVNKVGVCGMGGVGKTTLLNEVKKLVLENNLFDRVIKVEVGQSKSVFIIQEEIKDNLNMKLNKQSHEVRASRLQTYIAERKEKILFMLDDLWKDYDVEKEFGIRCHSESRIEGMCKIVMVGRCRDLFANQIKKEELFDVQILTEEESWSFFVAIVGDHQFDEQIAKDVVKECGGLPLALEVLAKTLREKRVEIWKDALKELKNPDIHGVSDRLYSCLLFSYDSIEDEAKLVLLLCSVFPDDHRIYVEDLQSYAMGLGLINHKNTWEDAKNRVLKLVGALKSSNLLLACDEEDKCVQMHDVIHDFAKYIASKIGKMKSLTYGSGQTEWEEDYRHGSYNAIYVDCTTFLNFPPKLEFPNLQLLILVSHRGRLIEEPAIQILDAFFEEPAIQISDTFFEGMEELRAVDVIGISFAPSSWTSLTHSLKNLHTLCLSLCDCNDIDTIGQLKKLEILKIICCEIQELPVCMSELTQLKVLQVMYCSKLKVIHPNIISKMIRLEEFSLSNFKGWGEEVWYKNKLITNAKLSELNCLKRLFHLGLNIQNVETLLTELSLERAQKLEMFSIFAVDQVSTLYNNKTYKTYATALAVDINSPIDSIGGVFQILLEKCEELEVKGSVGFTRLLSNNPQGNCAYPRLKHLVISCPHENGNMSPHHFDLQVAFPQLERFHIEGGNNFNTLWHNNGLTQNSFCKLQHIYIIGCSKLTCVFPSSMVRSLVFLNKLQVHDCELVERIFEMDDDQSIDGVNQAVPLTFLKLRFLPKLKHVWSNDPAAPILVTFPNLKEVKVVECPNLKTLFPASFINNMKEIENLYFDGGNEIFADEASQLMMSFEILLFPSLTELTIHYKLMNKRRFWLRPESFPKLQTVCLMGSELDDVMVSAPLEMSELVLRSVEWVKIKNARELVQVFQNGEDNNNNNHANSSGGAKLKYLTLANLPNLTRVWEDDIDQTTTSSCFDILDYISVSRCKNLKYLLPSSITFFNLTTLWVEDCNGMMNLFDSSVAKNLVNLKFMRVMRCTEMKYIVVAPKGEEEKVEEIVFNRLNELKLHNLTKLASFHSEKCMLKFPCLESLEISGCPEMETFNSSAVFTPKLSSVRIERDKVSVSTANGLNVIIEDKWKDEIVKSIKNLYKEEETSMTR